MAHVTLATALSGMGSLPWLEHVAVSLLTSTKLEVFIATGY